MIMGAVKTILPFLTAVLLSFSCSVKENRLDCPCYVNVNVDDYLTSGFDRALLSFSSGGLIDREEVDLSTYEGVGYEQAMPRRLGYVAVAAGLSKTMVKSDTLLTPYGLEADPLWLFCEEFLLSDDEYHIESVARKQYCRLVIGVKGLASGESYDYSFVVKGNCNAMDMYSATAIEGDYCAEATRNETGIFSVRIPRQKKSELLLEVIEKKVLSSSEERNVKFTVDLGAIFTASGYNWERKDLLDAEVSIDYANAQVSFRVEDWKSDDVFGDIKI